VNIFYFSGFVEEQRIYAFIKNGIDLKSFVTFQMSLLSLLIYLMCP